MQSFKIVVNELNHKAADVEHCILAPQISKPPCADLDVENRLFRVILTGPNDYLVFVCVCKINTDISTFCF